MLFPTTHDSIVAACYAELAQLDAARDVLYDDPMSAYAPLEDFAEDFDRRERAILARLSRRALQVGDAAARRFALDSFEKWMP
jgi:hypothetical protein